MSTEHKLHAKTFLEGMSVEEMEIEGILNAQEMAIASIMSVRPAPVDVSSLYGTCEKVLCFSVTHLLQECGVARCGQQEAVHTDSFQPPPVEADGVEQDAIQSHAADDDEQSGIA